MILNVYKPKSWTSFDVVAKVRNSLKSRLWVKQVKVGHAGTLDPLAEGVLVVLTGKDTKNQTNFMKMPKEYIAKIAFGIESPTYDLEGDLKVATQVPELESLKVGLQTVLPKYIGTIEQRVPPYSAVKSKGERLYKLARQEKLKNSELPVKRIIIYELEILDFKTEKVTKSGEKQKIKLDLPVLTCRILCSSGTYIRSLAHDLGRDLQTSAVLINLLRTKVGNFKIENAVTIEKLPLFLPEQ